MVEFNKPLEALYPCPICLETMGYMDDIMVVEEKDVSKEMYEWEKAAHGATEQELQRFKKLYAELFEKTSQKNRVIEELNKHNEALIIENLQLKSK